MTKVRLLGALAGFIVLACGTAWGQAYPSKPVRVVIVFPPAGATDIVGRIVFQKVGEQLGQQFIIDNRAGAGGTIGAALVAKSPPDGYTLMVYSATLVANAHLYKSLPYDSLKDFIGLSPVARLVGVLVVHPSMPVRSTRELINCRWRSRSSLLMPSSGTVPLSVSVSCRPAANSAKYGLVIWVSTTPIASLRCVRSEAAARLYTYPRSARPCWTRARVASATSGLLFSTRLTVARETPQCFATSSSVDLDIGLLSVL